MKARILVAAVGAALLATGTAWADGPLLVRVRAVNIDPANKSDAIAALAIPSDAIQVSTKVIPEVDISYFITPNIAAELILTYPQKHDVSVTQSAVGAAKLGSFKHLPPTLTAQWHFMPNAQFDPYVGVGINYTRISGVDLTAPVVGKLDLSKDSFGGALQAGFDYKLDNKWSINFDVKKVWISADVKVASSGTKVSTVKVDPLLVGIGVGYRF